MRKFLLTFAAVLFATVGFAQTNLLTNGGFEEWTDGLPTGWMKSTGANPVGSASVSQSSTARTGSSSVLITNTTAATTKTGNQRLATNPMTLEAGKYTFSVFTKAVSGQAASRVGYVPLTEQADGTYKAGSYSWGYNQNRFNGPDTISTEWFEQKYTFELKEKTLICLLVMHSKNFLDAQILADDASLVLVEGGSEEGGSGEGGSGEGGSTTEEVYTDAMSSQGGWSIKNLTLPTELTYVWKFDSYGYAKASAYNKTAYAAEADLVSPKLALGSNSVLSFDHVNRNGKNYSEDETVWVLCDGKSTQLTVPNYAPGTDWNFVNSGDISLSAFAGKTVQIVFKYKSSTESCGTWEVKNMKVTGAKLSDEVPAIKDPTNTEETAYTVAEAVSMIKSEEYDLTKEVYIKGIVVSADSFNETYGSITYWISDDGTETDKFEIYGGLSFGGSKFEGLDDLEDGDEVIVKGKMKKFVSGGETIYEMDKNNVLVKLNGNGPVTEVVATPTVSLKAGSYLADAAVSVTLACATEGAEVYYSLDGAEAVKGTSASIPVGTHTLVAYGQSASGAKSNVVLTAEYNVVAASALGSELANCDFESWAEGAPEGWTSITTASSAKLSEAEGRSGKGVKVAGASGKNTRLAGKEMKLAPGFYTLSAYVKDATAGEKAAMATVGYVPMLLQDAGNYAVGTYVYPKDGKNTVYTTLSSTEWKKVSFTFHIEKEEIVSLVVMNHYPADKTSCDILVDDVEFRAATEDEIAATGIATVMQGASNGAIYSLAGQRVAKAQKGVYIKGGKKVVVK